MKRKNGLDPVLSTQPSPYFQICKVHGFCFATLLSILEGLRDGIACSFISMRRWVGKRFEILIECPLFSWSSENFVAKVKRPEKSWSILKMWMVSLRRCFRNIKISCYFRLGNTKNRVSWPGNFLFLLLLKRPSDFWPICSCDKIVLEVREKQGNRQNRPE